MTMGEAINWIINLSADIGKAENKNLWHYEQALSEIKEMLECEPERKRGKWLYGEESGQDGWHCSECGFFVPWYYGYYGLDNIDFIVDYHTCPNCDAKMLKYTGMRGEQNEID